MPITISMPHFILKCRLGVIEQRTYNVLFYILLVTVHGAICFKFEKPNKEEAFVTIRSTTKTVCTRVALFFFIAKYCFVGAFILRAPH